jgi:uncharacterized protein
MCRSLVASAVCLGLVLITLGSAADFSSPAEPAQTAPAASLSPRQPQSLGDALHAAIRAGNLDEVKRLVFAGTDVNSPDALGSTPLVIAAWFGNTEIVSFLLVHGALVNVSRPEDRSTPLQSAVLAGQADTVKLLLAAGARLDTRYSNNQTVLHLAAARGNAQIVDLLLASHVNIGWADVDGNTALDTAVLHDRLQVASLLIAGGADVNRVHPLDARGALHEACVKGFTNLIALLVEAGADPTRPDRFGQTPLDLALAYKNGNTVAALLHLPVHRTEIEAAAEQAMESAISRGRTEIARTLIESGFEIEKPTSAGSTYLHDAALKSQKKMVQLLLDRGAHVNTLNRNGATPLQDAALGGNPEVIGLLLDRGAHIDATDEKSGATPLMLAAALARTQAVALLLARGANPTIKDHQGRTALERAKETEDEEIVKLLETAIAHSNSPQPPKLGGQKPITRS